MGMKACIFKHKLKIFFVLFQKKVQIMDKVVAYGKQKVTEQSTKLVALVTDKNSPIGKGKEAIVSGGKSIVAAAIKGVMK